MYPGSSAALWGRAPVHTCLRGNNAGEGKPGSSQRRQSKAATIVLHTFFVLTREVIFLSGTLEAAFLALIRRAVRHTCIRLTALCITTPSDPFTAPPDAFCITFLGAFGASTFGAIRQTLTGRIRPTHTTSVSDTEGLCAFAVFICSAITTGTAGLVCVWDTHRRAGLAPSRHSRCLFTSSEHQKGKGTTCKDNMPSKGGKEVMGLFHRLSLCDVKRDQNGDFHDLFLMDRESMTAVFF